MKSAALFYLVSSVLATGAFFMLSEMIERTQRSREDDEELSPFESFGLEDLFDPTPPDEDVGIVIPAAMAFLGMSFIACMLLVTGLPPLSGFIAKFCFCSGAETLRWSGQPVSVWVLWAAVLGSGLIGIIALCQMGVRLFWSSDEIVTPQLRLIEAAPVAVLLLLTAGADGRRRSGHGLPELAGSSLSSPQTYIDAVLSGNLPICFTLDRRRRAMKGWPSLTLFTASLYGLWLLLNDTLAPGQMVLGLVLTIAIALGTAAMRPLRARPHHLLAAVRLLFVVLTDIIRSNFAVAGVILGSVKRRSNSGFMKIPIDLRDPYGLAALACIITATPGTVWAGLSRRRPRPDDSCAGSTG